MNTISIIGAIAPLWLLDKIGLYLYVSVVPLGVHTLRDVGIVFAFVLFAIALSIAYITLIEKIDRRSHASNN